ncbi:type II toxin-antitoxin system ParD family antitoxin [Pseudomonas atacamensis]|uniref:type II toxin-antitoxin system ParD family antitoxin n=1 Tax=Pseudomonas atacamensis TaxID=2565368 RepID=UPI0038201405
MTTVRKISSATEQQAGRLKPQVEADRDADGNQCSEDSTHREQKQNAELETIRAGLLEGEASGKPQPFDAETIKFRMLKVLELQTRLQD